MAGNFDFFDFKKLEEIEKKAIKAAKHAFTPKDAIRRVYMTIDSENINERDKVSLFSMIVSMGMLTQEGRSVILNKGDDPEIQEYFKKELGIAWSPGYLDIKEDDGTIKTIKMMRYYLADHKPAFIIEEEQEALKRAAK